MTTLEKNLLSLLHIGNHFSEGRELDLPVNVLVFKGFRVLVYILELKLIGHSLFKNLFGGTTSHSVISI